MEAIHCCQTARSMSINKRIEGLARLGDYLKNDPTEMHSIMVQAELNNPWFSQNYIKYALQAISERYLDRRSLVEWTEGYEKVHDPKVKTVGLVMAGNIPLVGLHDIICVVVSGHKAIVKLSERDNLLIPFLLRKWSEFDPDINRKIELVDHLKGYDAVIATGSDNSSRYFEYYFRTVPHIIRKNRNGIAVLQGNESEVDLERLWVDIFTYYGLGCRNVSKIYVPKGYEFNLLLKVLAENSNPILHPKYKNNFEYNHAICVINRIPFLTNDVILMVEDSNISSRIGMIHYEYYDGIPELTASIVSDLSKIQCVVSQCQLGDIPVIDFGDSQKPHLYNYADGIDTMSFLLRLNDIK
jgi:hypothetical protein